MRSLQPTIGKRRNPDFRSGVAAVECAVCLPLMLLLTFGAIEASNSIYLKQITTQAAYEAARVASTPGKTEADARAVAKEILAARRVKDGKITITPAITGSTAAGTDIFVTVSAPSNSNAYAPLWFFKDAAMSARVVMVRN